MKKLLSVILCLGLIFSLTGCTLSKPTPDVSSETSEPPKETVKAGRLPEKAEIFVDGQKDETVTFSWSDNGCTFGTNMARFGGGRENYTVNAQFADETLQLDYGGKAPLAKKYVFSDGELASFSYSDTENKIIKTNNVYSFARLTGGALNDYIFDSKKSVIYSPDINDPANRKTVEVPVTEYGDIENLTDYTSLKYTYDSEGSCKYTEYVYKNGGKENTVRIEFSYSNGILKENWQAAVLSVFTGLETYGKAGRTAEMDMLVSVPLNIIAKMNMLKTKLQ